MMIMVGDIDDIAGNDGADYGDDDEVYSWHDAMTATLEKTKHTMQ